MESTGPVLIDNDGSEVIQRSIQLDHQDKIQNVSELFLQYEIEKTIKIVSLHDYKKIALQFPDELLNDSADVSRFIEQGSNAKSFILADTTFGSCCVDEVAAQHVDADFIVHYGNTCMSLTSKLPVQYVFTRKQYDLNSAASSIHQKIKETQAKYVKIESDTVYKNLTKELLGLLNSDGYARFTQYSCDFDTFFDPLCEGNSNTSKALQLGPVYNSTGSKGDTVGSSDDDRSKGDEPEEYSVLFIGAEGPKLSNLVMSNNARQVFSYCPDTGECREESRFVNRNLGRRFLAIQKARDAQTIGLVVGTLSSNKYIKVIEHLKLLLTVHRIKFYTILAGKINVAKIANFMEIEAFVLVACPENSLVDSKEFMQPIVTPFEFLCSLQDPSVYNLEYTTDFERFLEVSSGMIQEKKDEADKKENESKNQKEGENENGNKHNGDDDLDSESEIPHYSLATGKLVSSRKLPSTKELQEGEESLLLGPGASKMQVSLKDKNTQVAKRLESTAYEYFSKREYQGLEVDADDLQLKVELASEGRSGIARNYSSEKYNRK